MHQMRYNFKNKKLTGIEMLLTQMLSQNIDMIRLFKLRLTLKDNVDNAIYGMMFNSSTT